MRARDLAEQLGCSVEQARRRMKLWPESRWLEPVTKTARPGHAWRRAPACTTTRPKYAHLTYRKRGKA